jgi:hypothetical protein
MTGFDQTRSLSNRDMNDRFCAALPFAFPGVELYLDP